MRFSSPILSRSFLLAATLLLAFTVTPSHAQNYTSIVVFGDSLSDTGNVNALALAKYGLSISQPWADYTYGRFTDGKDTIPAARNYLGVWVEQLAALLPANPAVKASLSGGTNYAYGYAFTGTGTTPLTFGSYTVNVNNIGQQITTYLATQPKITSSTLFIVWGGANNILNAASPNDVTSGALDELSDIQRLIDAGATRILVPNLPPLGAIPALNASPTTWVPADEATVLYNSTLDFGLNILPIINWAKLVHIYKLDVFSIFNSVLFWPYTYGFANTNAMSQDVTTVNGLSLNPDTYLFWDQLHPTTHGHNLLAQFALKAVAPTLFTGIK